jgi:acetyl esterase/lipase
LGCAPGRADRARAGQAALLVNLWTSSVFARAVASQFLARPEFARAMLQQGKIEQKSGSSKALQLLTFLPLLTVARRFKTVRVQRDLHYSSLQITDPLLHERIMRTPQTIKMLNKLSLRGTHTRWNALDVVTTDPPPPPGAPVLVYIHGGGWFLGDKLFAGYSVIQRIASRGVVVFTINYRMSPETAFPGQIVDAKRALLWVKRNCHTYNGNARKIFVTGESAGGHLTALMATTPNFGPFQPPEDPAADTSVQGAIPLCGVFDWSDRNGHLEDLHVPLLEGARSTFRPYMERVVMQSTFKLNEDAFDNASPTFHVREMARRDSAPDLCPLMVVHGTLDALASLEDARAFFEAVRKVREKFGSWAPGEGDIFVENKDAHHAVGYFPSVRAMALGDAVVDFVTHHAGRLG